MRPKPATKSEIAKKDSLRANPDSQESVMIGVIAQTVAQNTRHLHSPEISTIGHLRVDLAH